MSIKASFKAKQLNTSEINNNYLFVSLVFYTPNWCEVCLPNLRLLIRISTIILEVCPSAHGRGI
jgi:predicted Zn-dependent protease